MDSECECDLAMIFVTLLITGLICLICLARWVSPSIYVPPEAVCSLEEGGLPQIEFDHSSVKGIQIAVLPC